MVISKDGKRKCKEINLIDSSPEVPKRIKVHAQRKFAQGQGTSSTYALGLPSLPQPSTPTKESRVPPPELLTNNRPNTDDFLTFLCFRGTSILPPNLDFFNSQNRTTTSSSESPNTTNTVNTEIVPTPNAEPSNKDSKTEVIKDDKIVEKGKEKEPPGFIPFGVRKRAEQIPEPRCRQTVQALKKKYHEQRMAKLKTLGKANKQQNIMRTRSNKVIEAISKRNKNNTKSLNSNKVKKETIKMPVATTPVSKAIQNKRKIDLRSASSTNSLDQSVQEKQIKHAKVDKMEKTKVQNDVEVKKQPKEVFVKKDFNKTKEIDKSVVKKKINVLCKDALMHPNLRNKNKLIKNLKTNKLKQVSAVAAAKVIRVTRLMKTLNRVTDDTKSETNTGNKVSDTELKESETEEEFSTDDDQPLAISKKPDKSNSSSKNAIKAVPQPIKAKKSLEKPIPKILPNRKNVFRRSVITPPPESSPNTQTKPAIPEVKSQTKDYVGRSKTRLSQRVIRNRSDSKSDESSKISSKSLKVKEVIKKEKTKINDKSNTTIPNTSKSKPNDKHCSGKKCLSVDLDTTPSKSDNESITKAVKVSKNKKANVPNKTITNSTEKLNNDSSQANLTDLSENENRSRPTRKTKEAATIYMELIGRKLNLQDDLDEDDTSIDSFPELPNVRKTEQMENELKANVGKEKPIGKEKPLNKKKIKIEYDSFDEKVKDTDLKKICTKQLQPMGNCKSEDNKKIEPVKKEIKKEETKCKMEKLEKSFSDSDEEPLATKLINYKVKPFENGNKKSLISSVAMEPVAIILEASKAVQKEISPIKQTPEESHKSESSNVVIKTPDPKTVESNLNIDEKSTTLNTQPETTKFTKTKTSVAKNISRTDSNAIKNKIIHLTDTKLEMPLHMAVQWYNQQMTPRSPAHPNQYGTSSLRSLMNPLPSKEESGKIFGIASVTLAQSSGPMDTKCTLGKCGSIHKPPLGPVFPTETLLIDNLSTKERRRAKVNMTQEQIEKWLIDCSSEPEEILDDLEIDEIDLKSTPKPINYLQAPSPTREIILPAKNNRSREKLSQASRGTSLKAMAASKNNAVDDDVIIIPTKNNKNNKNTKTSSPYKEIDHPIKEKSIIKKVVVSKEVDNKTSPLPVQSTQNITHSPAAGVTTNETTPQKVKVGVPQKTKSPQQQKSPSKLSNTAITPKPGTTLDRKPIFNQRRTPVYSNKQQELIKSTKSKGIVNTFGAFSPENEHSIYSFDKEDDFIPAATPFRRQSHKESKDDIEKTPIKKEQTNATTSTSPSQICPGTTGMVTPTKSVAQDQQQVSLTLSPEDNSKSASITVHVNLDSETKNKSNLPSKQITGIANDKQTYNDGNESDTDGHTFYIPLQGTIMAGSKTDQLIQGVAVKLDTEGPDGPNQRVIMHAKLVTKAQMGHNPTPMPESMANVQEIVKSLIASKEASGSKSVPVGTVQPRFKSGDTIANSSSKNLPGTSNTTQKVTNELKRVNSNSSLVSQKSKPSKVPKIKNDIPIQPSNNTAFPWLEDPTQMVEAPTFTPTEKEFQDPIEFIERITPIAARFGICRIIPPASFKPECRVSDDMRFTAYNQYVHKMLHRWGPSAKEFSAIKKYLATQSITLTHPPWIGGMEVDLPRMYHTVQELGGLSEVIEKKKWARVAEEMCIPKSAQDRVTKLDDIYCKYLLPYDTLSPTERQKLFDEVEADWAKREAKARRNADKRINLDSNSIDESEEEEEDSDSEEGDSGSMECIVKGRSMALNAFYRIARNTMALWFKNTEPTAADVEAEFWRHVAVRDSHVCVHSGSIDSSGWGYGFPTPGPKGKSSPCSKHPWNLKVFTNNSGSVLRSLGPVMGVTVPTLYVGMLFSACCWYRDPHGLPWIEYLHTGANKIWYGVPDEQSTNFRAALTSLVPTHCQNKKIWLPCDTAMVPPHMLTDRGVSLCRTEQQPGQFVIVFPRAYTSSISTGYVVSESVSFATNKWLESAEQDFKDIQASCEPTTFSLEQLLFAIASDQRSNNETLLQILPMITEVYEKEVKYRQDLTVAGVTINEKLQTKGKKQISEENECELCRTNLFISMLKTDEELIYCLKHGLQLIENKQIKVIQLKLIYTYSIDDIQLLIKRLKERLNIKENNINNNNQQLHIQQLNINNNKNVKKINNNNNSAISSCISNNNNKNNINNTNKKK